MRRKLKIVSYGILGFLCVVVMNSLTTAYLDLLCLEPTPDIHAFAMVRQPPEGDDTHLLLEGIAGAQDWEYSRDTYLDLYRDRRFLEHYQPVLEAFKAERPYLNLQPGRDRHARIPFIADAAFDHEGDIYHRYLIMALLLGDASTAFERNDPVRGRASLDDALNLAEFMRVNPNLVSLMAAVKFHSALMHVLTTSIPAEHLDTAFIDRIPEAKDWRRSLLQAMWVETVKVSTAVKNRKIGMQGGEDIVLYLQHPGHTLTLFHHSFLDLQPRILEDPLAEIHIPGPRSEMREKCRLNVIGMKVHRVLVDLPYRNHWIRIGYTAAICELTKAKLWGQRRERDWSEDRFRTCAQHMINPLTNKPYRIDDHGLIEILPPCDPTWSIPYFYGVIPGVAPRVPGQTEYCAITTSLAAQPKRFSVNQGRTLHRELLDESFDFPVFFRLDSGPPDAELDADGFLTWETSGRDNVPFEVTVVSENTEVCYAFVVEVE